MEGRRLSWRDEAACSGKAAETFFSETLREQAKAICSSCDVVIECRTYAVATSTRFGIFGGMDPAERREWAKAQGHSAQTREYQTVRSW